MSIAKTLISKEIERYKRMIPAREGEMKNYKKLQFSDVNKKLKKPFDYSDAITNIGESISTAIKAITELEKDLKKL